MIVERKLDGAVDKSSADQDIRKSDATIHNLLKIWRPAPSVTGSYGRQVVCPSIRQTKFGQGLKFKSLIIVDRNI